MLVIKLRRRGALDLFESKPLSMHTSPTSTHTNRSECTCAHKHADATRTSRMPTAVRARHVGMCAHNARMHVGNTAQHVTSACLRAHTYTCRCTCMQAFLSRAALALFARPYVTSACASTMHACTSVTRHSTSRRHACARTRSYAGVRARKRFYPELRLLCLLVLPCAGKSVKQCRPRQPSPRH